MKRQFNEFKSVFASENLLKENEEHANIVTASTMINIFWIFLITWILTYFNVFKIGMQTMNIVMIGCISLLIIPSIICYKNKGKGKWIKHMLFISFTLLLALADAMLKYNVTLIMTLPIILAARYYNKKFTILLSVFITCLFAISTFISINVGQQDLNSYNLIIPKGTTITIDNTLRESITSIDVDNTQRLINIFIHLFLPKLLIFNIIAFACVQISQSGKNMIKKQKEITQTSERIDTELNLASSIQKSMLPSIFPPFPSHDEIDIYASMFPAKEIGGDFYDMFLIDDNHLAICIADVTGKGIPASLVMMISKILIKNVSKIDMDVSKSFTRVNNMLSEDNKTDIFITSWIGILDLRNGKIEYVNAGHNPPLIYSNKTGKYTYLKTKPNFVLAGMKDTKYNKGELQIEPGDKILLYTDGVIEATNTQNELYGEDRLINYLNEHSNLDVKETIMGIKNDVDSFVGTMEQFDDITMLELLYKEKREDNSLITKEFDAKKDELLNIQNFVSETLNIYDCNKKTITQINLAIEEIFINIVNYAYKDKKGKCTLGIKNENNTFSFIFEDNGIPFNPLDNNLPDTTLSAKERQVGGLGIFLTKKVMDNVEYKYENNKNILVMTKKI